MNASERVLILTPGGRDGAVAEALLHEAGQTSHVCAGLDALVEGLDAGAGVAVLADEALHQNDIAILQRWISRQPSWSDFPFLVLTVRGGGPDRNPFLARIAAVLGNVMFLERPFHPTALVTSVENALRGRRRQYQARANLDALSANEKRLSLALGAGRFGAFQLDIAGGALECSERCKAHFGRTSEAPLGMAELISSVAEEQRARVEAALTRDLDPGRDIAIDFPVTWPDGSAHWVEMRAGVLPDRYGRAVTLSGVISDVTERKAAEAERESLLEALAIEREHTQQALRGEKAFSGLLMSSVPAGIVAYDHEMVIATWNPVMERLVGLSEREVVGKRLQDVIADDVVDSMRERVEDALAGTAGPIEELEFSNDSGPSLWLETQHAPLGGGDGQIVGGVAFFRDVTERRRAEEQLRQAQKMETIGQLTGGVAHDFNNLLAAVLGNLELLGKKLPPDPVLHRHIDGAMQGARRGAALTQRLLAFARRQDLKPEAVDLKDLLDGMRGLMERSLGPLISIEFDIEHDLPPATVDPNQLELAVLNLAVNARDAMPEGGRLLIRLDKREPRRSLGLFGQYVRLCVEDSGTGMDAETLKRAIEPFFSTKELGKGTGLGLSMVHGLAVQLGGALNLYSEMGRGTIAELWLPVSAGPIEHVKESVPMNEVAPRSRILVVDDDALIAMNTVDMVEDLGHTVLEAYSGKQALEILQSDAEIDALITDYAMPGMTGVELANKARELRPGLPILLATGYADLPSGTTTDLPRLGKPYQQRDLSEHLTRLLGQRQTVAQG